MQSIEEIFNNLDGELEGHGPVVMKNMVEKEGKNVVGTYCVFTPYEVIRAAGAVPVTLCSTSNDTIDEAEKDLPRNLCPLIKSSYGFAITDKCPYFHFADIIVGETTCDGKKKMYEYLNEVTPVHVMKLPQSSHREVDLDFWKNEVLLLKDTLEEKFETEITEQRLKEEIKIKNEERNTLKEFYELAKLKPSPIYGSEIFKVLNISSYTFDKEIANKRTKAITEKILKNYKKGEKRISADAPRILVTGCPMGAATLKVIEAIENNGGSVVCLENCTGLKPNEETVSEDKSPVDAIAEKYLNTPCSCISPNDNRVELINRLVEEYQVDGVVDMVLQACHTYNVETKRIKDELKKSNTSYLNIETDYSQSDKGQLETRLTAFLEMM
ncbi:MULTISPECIES: double-cubane-cluster-containing anaerobic reductase [unclassified Halanaerobium]|uniref:double-cubane-cluster-containing anaerobic reductase n=1 Tax=unclassified Halanaerobium TaxID=2641197 RepID=UPI000DF3FC78|nr:MULTISPECIES: double-cubane-cluster-containing anaerobic reductase [unclassified Halanaerobium]RCW41376.1 benzoyl-CoA reductase/2-hydroxyglutaryl-CoA dehydratase subunit BcrC/BadD/HgdB [Halanaerobium sp. MA284_MarDTE_T2]RCW86957.1 benzoyl-CoA reductase/2-hydroxyglutaryl-CoA dehydratase subunit BcrC/BadD/HgdB [Halanaerobium sp. DL-01]